MNDNARPLNEGSDVETYPHPSHGWTCFHCGDTFHGQAQARNHFGWTTDAEPGCVLKLSAEDRSLLRHVRAQEIRNAELTADLHNETTLSQHHSHATRAELQGFKPFRQCATIQDVFNVYDSMEGRALAAEESQERSRGELAEAKAENERLTKDLSETTLAWATAADDRDNYSGQLAALESHQRWRSVAEGLPEHLQRVLVFDGETVLVAGYHDTYGFTGPHRFETPTHWMPLPDLPAKAAK